MPDQAKQVDPDNCTTRSEWPVGHHGLQLSCSNEVTGGNPTGGHCQLRVTDKLRVDRNVLHVLWQRGPLEDGRPNGAFVEDVIQAAIQRLTFFQEHGKFACGENEEAISHLEMALEKLGNRTSRRKQAGTEGTHETDAGDAGHAAAPGGS